MAINPLKLAKSIINPAKAKENSASNEAASKAKVQQNSSEGSPTRDGYERGETKYSPIETDSVRWGNVYAASPMDLLGAVRELDKHFDEVARVKGPTIMGSQGPVIDRRDLERVLVDPKFQGAKYNLLRQACEFVLNRDGVFGRLQAVGDFNIFTGYNISKKDLAVALRALTMVPEMPPDINLQENIDKAKSMGFSLSGLKQFYEHVRNGGPWDYKQQGSQYEDFGNFHFGMMGAAMGIPEEILLRGAGWAQEQAGTSSEEFGHWYDLFGNSSYGDDPKDQEMIRLGIAYYKLMYG